MLRLGEASEAQTTIDADALAGNECRLAEKEGDAPSDLLRFAQATERGLADEALPRCVVVRQGRRRRGLDEPREYRVTRILYRPHSSAATRVSMSTPALDAE